MLTAGAASACVGAATLRLRSDYLAITSFGVAVAVQLVLRNCESLTGGNLGIGDIPRPFALLLPEPIAFALANLMLATVIVAGAMLLLERLRRSPWGRVLRAIREDERAAGALGKHVARYRVEAFAFGGALMGLAGAMQAHWVGFIAPDNYEAALTFQVWTMLIVGGAGNNRGALLGAGVVSVLWSASGLATGFLFPPEDQARAAALRIVAIGVLLAVMIVLRPRGLIGERLGVSRR
jgi:branched-chain amino acid transport system permease protein